MTTCHHDQDRVCDRCPRAHIDRMIEDIKAEACPRKGRQ